MEKNFEEIMKTGYIRIKFKKEVQDDDVKAILNKGYERFSRELEATAGLQGKLIVNNDKTAIKEARRNAAYSLIEPLDKICKKFPTFELEPSHSHNNWRYDGEANKDQSMYLADTCVIINRVDAEDFEIKNSKIKHFSTIKTEIIYPKRHGNREVIKEFIKLYGKENMKLEHWIEDDGKSNSK